MTKARLIVFTRFPELGKVKTRLVSTLGNETATSIHTALARKTFETLRRFRARTNIDIDIEVHFAGGDIAGMSEVFGSDFTYIPQHTGDLGERLLAASRAAFASGVEQLAIIGTDCPWLTTEHLSGAFQHLGNRKAVLGPATDGGYYLIGLNRSVSDQRASGALQRVFTGIDWGSEQVLSQTKTAFRTNRWQYKTLEPLSDVDFAQDLVGLRSELNRFNANIPEPVCNRLSVIIPTRNEAACIRQTIERLVSAAAEPVEVIVVDGHSTDATVELAAQANAIVVTSAGGRGAQMNVGAVLATGDALMFLHADTRVPDRYDQIVRDTLVPGVGMGAFRLGVTDCTPALQMIVYGANLRSAWCSKPYGDQAYFMMADRFHAMRGFRCWPLMEDFEFCTRARKFGRIVIAQEAVSTSDRRWRKRGYFKTFLMNQAIVAAYYCGVPPTRLAAWYRTKAS